MSRFIHIYIIVCTYMHIYTHTHRYIYTSSSSSSRCVASKEFLWLFLAISTYHLSILVGLLDCIQYPHRADVCKSLQTCQHWFVHVLESIRQNYLWLHPYFSSSIPNAFFILLGWFVRWEEGGCTTTVL